MELELQPGSLFVCVEKTVAVRTAWVDSKSPQDKICIGVLLNNLLK